MILERIILMKKLLLLLFCIVYCVLCVDLKAQDDAESILSGDVEVEGLDNFWVESRLITDIDVADSFRPARLAGGNIVFLTHVQRYISKVFNILFEKYPDEMLNRVGMHTEVHIEFTVTKNAEIELGSISNGAVFGLDVVVVDKMLKSYKKRWMPAKVNGEAVDSRVELVIDVSI